MTKADIDIYLARIEVDCDNETYNFVCGLCDSLEKHMEVVERVEALSIRWKDGLPEFFTKDKTYIISNWEWYEIVRLWILAPLQGEKE